MAYLYELEGIYAQLQSMDLDEETFQDTLDSIDFQADLENNIEYFVKMLKNAQANEEMYKAEKEAFYEKQKQAQAKIDKYKETIHLAMALSNKKKVDAGMFKVSLRKNKKRYCGTTKTHCRKYRPIPIKQEKLTHGNITYLPRRKSNQINRP